jgi:hypothetical protein
MNLCFYFLGSVYFALILIGAAAALVAIGTFVESKNGSHLSAVYSIYSHQSFIFLLSGFFLNILISALRRWPFKKRHIPFLTTHLGLLMILAGVMAKNLFGLQAIMPLVSGSETDEVFIPYSHALLIEQAGSIDSYPIDLSHKGAIQKKSSSFPDLQLYLVTSSPHGKAMSQSWFHKDSRGNLFLQLLGIRPIQAVKVSNESTLKPALKTTFSSEGLWNIFAIETDNLLETAEKLFAAAAKLSITDSETGQVLSKHSLKSYLDSKEASLTLSFDGQLSTLQLSIPSNSAMTIPLNGPLAMLNLWHGLPKRIAIDLISEPSVVFIYVKPQESGYLFAYNSSGEIFFESLEKLQANSLIAYDSGKSGYGRQITLPFSAADMSREKREEAFLSTLPEDEHNSLRWIEQIISELAKDKLSLQNWPIPLPDGSIEEKIEAIAEQIFAARSSLPKLPKALKNLFSIYSMGWISSLDKISAEKEILQILARHRARVGQEHSQTVLEAPIRFVFSPETPAKRQEESRPIVTLFAKEKGRLGEKISLLYEPSPSGLKLPLFDGKYLVRFQPETYTLPWRVRLHDARQINYPGSQQPLSYESTISLSDKQGIDSIFTTLSMNHVFETDDGFRFYLSSLAPADETALQHVHLAVNQDRFKYFLTYPGALILTLGILLFLIITESRGGKQRVLPK